MESGYSIRDTCCVILENHRPLGYEDRLAFFLIRFLSRMSAGKDAGLQSVRSLR